jgi:hypothetical protein
MGKEMRELYIEGLATHDDPESCVGVCEGVGEALTGARAGRVIEPRNQGVRGADAVKQVGRQHRWWRYARVARGPRAVGERVHVRNLHAREPGDPTIARPVDGRAGRLGNAEAVSLR